MMIDGIDLVRLSDGVQVGTALGRISRLQGPLRRREQQGEQQGNDANDHQQFDEGEGATCGW